MILFVTTLCSNNNFTAQWNKKNVLLHKYYQIYYITNEQFLY